MERIIDLQLRHKDRPWRQALWLMKIIMVVKLKFFLFFFFKSCSSFLFFFFFPLPSFIALPPLALTIHVHYDLWVIAGHHLFSRVHSSFFCAWTPLHTGHFQTIPLCITRAQLASQSKLSEANSIRGRERCNEAKIKSINRRAWKSDPLFSEQFTHQQPVHAI